jgi:hypothetical protein
MKRKETAALYSVFFFFFFFCWMLVRSIVSPLPSAVPYSHNTIPTTIKNQSINRLA